MFAVAAYAQPTMNSNAVPQTPPDNTQMGGPPPATDNGPGMAPGGMSAAATGMAADTSATVDANGVVWHASQPIPDTPADRAAYGQPLSRTGKMTAPIGN
jgi:hypothetical protein